MTESRKPLTADALGYAAFARRLKVRYTTLYRWTTGDVKITSRNAEWVRILHDVTFLSTSMIDTTADGTL